MSSSRERWTDQLRLVSFGDRITLPDLVLVLPVPSYKVWELSKPAPGELNSFLSLNMRKKASICVEQRGKTGFGRKRERSAELTQQMRRFNTLSLSGTDPLENVD